MKIYLNSVDIQKAEEAGIRFYNSSQEQELFYLKEALKRTDEGKFLFLTNLMKMQLAMQKAKFIDEK